MPARFFGTIALMNFVRANSSEFLKCKMWSVECGGSPHVTTCHTCHGICTLSPLDAARSHNRDDENGLKPNAGNVIDRNGM